MALFQSDNGPVEVADPLVQAVARSAAFAADLTAAVLDATGLFPAPSQVRLPAGFLVELAAVLQIGFWERQGISIHQEGGLPSFGEASKELAARAEQGSTAFEGREATSLSLAVMTFWIEHFAWEGRSLLSSDIVVGDIEDDQFADLLAQFLWNHRQQLSHFLDQGESDHVG